MAGTKMDKEGTLVHLLTVEPDWNRTRKMLTLLEQSDLEHRFTVTVGLGMVLMSKRLFQ